MKQIHSLLCLLLLVVSFTACESNDDSNSNSQNDNTFAQNFGNSVSKDFIGQVVDTDNNPIQSATITIGTSTVQTDVNGVFIINGASVHEKFAYITATKAGYVDGSRAMVPTSGKNNVKIMLIPNAPLQTVQSGVDSEVALPSGTKVNFDGEFQDENGAAYTGTVSVAMFHLLPSDENIDKLMPGMLYAQTKTNQEAVLETFGMLNVELRGSAGQKLNIKEGHTAEITLKIDDSQVATSPSSIPLWHFDEAKGYWKEDGVATKVGDKYVGEVSHFSWWNCDAQFPTVRLTTTVVDSDGNPLGNVSVYLAANDTLSRNGITDDNGQVSGLVPANATMTITVLDICGNSIYTGTIGPFASDTVLPNIVITSAMATPTVVQGALLKCDNTNITNGYVLMQYGTTQSIAAVTSGTFSFSTLVCPGDNTFTLEGFDYDNLQTTGTINYTFTSPITNIGVLTACNAITEFISYQVDSNAPVFFLNNLNAITATPFGPGLSINSNGVNGYIFIHGRTNVPGIYTTAQFSIGNSDIGDLNSGSSNTIQFNLTSFGSVGQYVDMTFSGTYTNGTVVHNLTGVIHVLRDD